VSGDGKRRRKEHLFFIFYFLFFILDFGFLSLIPFIAIVMCFDEDRKGRLYISPYRFPNVTLLSLYS
jgi:hypothetical protein